MRNMCSCFVLIAIMTNIALNRHECIISVGKDVRNKVMSLRYVSGVVFAKPMKLAGLCLGTKVLTLYIELQVIGNLTLK